MVGNRAKFTWGDVVKISNISAEEYPLNEIGTVCGITKISNRKLAELYMRPVGSYIYTVEFSSGNSYGVPEDLLIEQMD